MKQISNVILLASLLFMSSIQADNALFSFKRIGQVAPSPNGKQVAIVTYEFKNTALGKEWLYSLYLKDQSGLRVLANAKKITSISWSPDGNQITYLSEGKKSQSIWSYQLNHHKKDMLFEFTSDIESFKWSPNGKMIAFMSHDLKPESKILQPIDVSKQYTNMRLYVVSLENQTNIKAEALTPSTISISQFFVYPGFDWSQDSRVIALAYQPQSGAQYSLQNKIGFIDLKTHKLRNIPYSTTHNSSQPAYSPDGKWVAFQANPSDAEVEKQFPRIKPNQPYKGLLAQNFSQRICVANVATLETHCLAKTPDEFPSIVGWNTDSDHVFVLEPYKSIGYEIYSLSLNPANPSVNISHLNGFINPLTISLNHSNTLFGFGYETVNQAPQAFITNTASFNLQQITEFKNLYSSPIGDTKTLHWKSNDGTEIEGLLVTPQNYKSDKKYPLYLAIHGGPTSAWAKRYLGGCDEYGEMIDPTTCLGNLLEQGFIIFQPNPRGSTGYGQKFRLANFADFGGGDFQDIMSGLDFLTQNGTADNAHLAIGGWSFGGYMTAWIISQTNRFKAAVEGDGNTNFISFSGTSDIPDYYIEYLGNPFWENDLLYKQRAPISFVNKITTPLLIIGGENDSRVPITQGYELYTALKKLNRPVKMLLLPKQGHLPTDTNLISAIINDIDVWLKQAL
ncbi:MAG: S9 family peptidase [Proteobacteria bacterium]|nr:S9 family peptidase [Pseudomonadota bacterium]